MSQFNSLSPGLVSSLVSKGAVVTSNSFPIAPDTQNRGCGCRHLSACFGSCDDWGKGDQFPSGNKAASHK